MNTRRYFIEALFLVMACGVYAQDNQQSRGEGTSGYLSFSGGISFPQADYSAPANTLPMGYAQTGGDFTIGLGVTPAHFPLGFAFLGGYYFNRYDFMSYINRQQSNDMNSSYGTSQPNANHMFYSGFYGMAGLYKEIVLGRVAFDFRGLMGELNASTPEMSYYATQQSGSIISSSSTEQWDTKPAKGSAFAYDLGITARIKRAMGFNLFLNFDFVHSNVAYSTTQYYTDAKGNTSNTVSDYTLPVQFISFTLGVGYDLGQ
jgi:hypothetical protein